MNLKKIGIVISREYSVRVRKKSFIITTILTPLLIGLLICVPAAIMLLGGEDTKKVKVVDESGLIASQLKSDESVEYVLASGEESVEALVDSFFDTDLYAVVSISPVDEKGEVSVTTYSGEPLNMELKMDIGRAVNKVIENRKLAGYDIDNLDRILADVKTDIKINSMTLSKDGDAKEESVEVYMILAYLMSFLIYMFVLLFGTMVMRSVIDEKSSRVVEVVVSSVRSVELMMGKIIGVALVALTQFCIWVVLTLLIIFGAGTIASDKLVEKAGGMEAVMATVQQSSETSVSASASTPDIATLLEQVSADGENDGIASVVRQVTDMHWGYILFCFLAYFLLGYLLYAAMFAAIGAAVDNEADTGQLQMPVTIPLIIGLFIMLHTFEHPSSALSFWASVIPFTSPMVMLARIPFGVVPVWELALSLGLLLLTFLGIAYLSAKVYKVGILTYGKKTSFKDMIKWLKQRN
ncbi:MAG: ABC transporter permease [Bacteroidales bacterium]|nr:ABC transporter permease [Candidatus Cacconaster merdequi]